MMTTDTMDFFHCDDFAIPARLGSGASVNGIFDLDVRQVLGVDVDGPAFTCPSDVPIAAGDVLTISGNDYRVVGRVTGDEQVVTWQLHNLS